jgi:hypothetical protein
LEGSLQFLVKALDIKCSVEQAQWGEAHAKCRRAIPKLFASVAFSVYVEMLGTVDKTKVMDTERMPDIVAVSKGVCLHSAGPAAETDTFLELVARCFDMLAQLLATEEGIHTRPLFNLQFELLTCWGSHFPARDRHNSSPLSNNTSP